MHTLQVISENWVSAGQASKTLLFFKWVGGDEALGRAEEEGERVTGLKGCRISVCIKAAVVFATLLLGALNVRWNPQR